MKKILIIATVPSCFSTLIKGQAKYLSNYFEVKLVTSPNEMNAEIREFEGVDLYEVEMARKITPFKDLKSLFNILSIIRKEKPDIVYSFTPKAGLLGMIASFIARVPIRAHFVVGLPLIEAKGVRRIILKWTEKTTYMFANYIYSNSFNLKTYIKKLTKKKVNIIGNGSINGVNTKHFYDDVSDYDKRKLKSSLGLDSDDFIITFVGRIVRDKGVNELVSAFSSISTNYPRLKLLLVGDYDSGLNPVDSRVQHEIEVNKNIVMVNFQEDVKPFLAISSLFVLPSYREGLPNALLEAGSFSIPLVATNINGCNEVIIPYENGILVDLKDEASLKDGILEFYNNNKLYKDVKSKCRESICNRYDQEKFLEMLRDEFKNLINATLNV
ncbi:glycosyltransferase family 4 protein [Cysteiniphilum sp. 6C5]|uniref:glycosyltransferase family 4 protein n=1 Tax=unclassified Cysteiniphilum TaxID=2610889 RepID=UPI003F848BF6